MYYLPAYQNINIENTLVLPNLSAFDAWNNTINAEFEHRYDGKAGNGSAMIGLRSSALYSTFDYTSLYAQILHHKDLGKLEFRTRLFAQYMTGTNAAPESQLYLAGGNAEEMVESKFSRAAGIIPADWFSYGSSSNHFHSQGGLNIRGYAGYLVPVIDGTNQYLAYRGNSGASVNLEMDFDQFFPIPAKGIFRPFHMDTYLFADAGILQSNSSFIADLQNTGKAFTTPLMASSGLGAALTIKRWGKLDDIKPLTIRFDMPMYLSNAPYVDGDNFKFRWMMGISRAF
jgi:aminopeptidase N